MLIYRVFGIKIRRDKGSIGKYDKTAGGKKLKRNIWRLFVSSSLISIMAANSILAAGWK